MADLETLLEQYLQPPVLPPSAATKPALAPAPLGPEINPAFDTNATLQEQLNATKYFVQSGKAPYNAAMAAQVSKMQALSDAQEDAIRNSKTTLDSMAGLVDELLLNDLYRNDSGEQQAFADDIFGIVSKGVRNIATKGDSDKAAALMATLSAKAFLENYEKLKGAGAISNTEGEKGATAYSVLFAKDGTRKYGLSESETKKQLKILREQIQLGQDRLASGLRWDEDSGKAIPESQWLEKNRSSNKASGNLPTESEGAAIEKKSKYATVSDSTKIGELKEGDKFYYEGKLYKKGKNDIVYNATE